VAESLLEKRTVRLCQRRVHRSEWIQRGIFEVANRGTVFLDEIGDTTQAMQSKLLRVLESGEILPVGSDNTSHVDVRIIAATHRNLTERWRPTEFREDLYYRLKVVTIELPPLRERMSDLPLLFDFFLKRYSAAQGKTLAVHPEVLSYLSGYSWPGNVRQLETSSSAPWRSMRLEFLQSKISRRNCRHPKRKMPQPHEGAWMTLAEMEERYIEEVIAATGATSPAQPEILGIDRRTLYRRMDRSG